MSGHPKILVLRGGAIGDFVLTLPALHALRRQWPAAYIELVGYPHIAQLAKIAGLVDRVRSLDKANMAAFFAPDYRFDADTRDWIASFDVIVSFLHDPEGVVRSNMEMAGARQVLYGSPIVIEKHAADHLAQPLESLAIYPDSPGAALVWPAHRTVEGKKRLAECGIAGRALALHPGSGSARKNWPVDRFIDVAEQLRTDGYSPFFLLGEADRTLAPEVERQCASIARIENRPLDEVADVLSACCGYVGNDSGITHLAAALAVPSVALFGPSNAALWAPRGVHVCLMEAPGGDLSRISIEEVLKALRCLATQTNESLDI
jgi:heptosyltransferase-2